MTLPTSPLSDRLGDPLTGWSFDCPTDQEGTGPPPGGLQLTKIQHNSHNFCKDLRVIGIRLTMEQVRPDGSVVATTSHFLELSDPPFIVGPLHVIWQYRTPVEADRFSSYFSLAFSVRCDFTLPHSYVTAHWPNCELKRLAVSQRFRFSPYGNSPPHEPSGNLTAARCHPMMQYNLVSNPLVDKRRTYYRVAKIRFDYRLHLFIDRHYSSPNTLPQIGNSAGLFADEESISRSDSIADLIFSAIEKPLVREVATWGLYEGTNFVGERSGQPTDATPRAWDNIHWWGARGQNQPIISAPGAFHAAHCHWRWGGVLSSLRSTIPEIDGTGGPRGFRSRFWGSDRLQVDPGIWMQTIRIGVTKNSRSLDPDDVALEALCPPDWQTLFTRRSPEITNIGGGDDLVMWYSAEIPREVSFPPESDSMTVQVPFGAYTYSVDTSRPALTQAAASSGTVFLHGLFFAHEAEQDGLFVGSTTPEHFPRSRVGIEGLTGTAAWTRTWTP
jgi:hypothetical protein